MGLFGRNFSPFRGKTEKNTEKYYYFRIFRSISKIVSILLFFRRYSLPLVAFIV